MIRVEIVANSAREAEELAALLAAEEQIEVISARAYGTGYRSASQAEVVIALHLRSIPAPAGGPRLVTISEQRSRMPGTNSALRAVLPGDASPSEITAAALAAAADLYVLTEEQLGLAGVQAETDAEVVSVQEKLTRRESEVLRMMADGAGNKEIASGLGISTHTAKFHVAQVLAKLGASSRVEAVRLGIRRGLVAI